MCNLFSASRTNSRGGGLGMVEPARNRSMRTTPRSVACQWLWSVKEAEVGCGCFWGDHPVGVCKATRVVQMMLTFLEAREPALTKWGEETGFPAKMTSQGKPRLDKQTCRALCPRSMDLTLRLACRRASFASGWTLEAAVP